MLVQTVKIADGKSSISFPASALERMGIDPNDPCPQVCIELLPDGVVSIGRYPERRATPTWRHLCLEAWGLRKADRLPGVAIENYQDSI